MRISVSIQFQVNPTLASPKQILFHWGVMIVRFQSILKLVHCDSGETRQINIFLDELAMLQFSPKLLK